MSDHFADRVKETTTTTSTGDITLGGAVAGFRTFASQYDLNSPFPYVIDGGTEWEVGLGYLSGSTTLVRQTVTSSSNSNALVNFSAGSKDVFVDASAYFLSGFRRHGQILAAQVGAVYL